MPIPIQLKRNGTASETPSSLLHGEIALNYADGKLFWKDASNVIQSFTFQSYALASHTHAASDVTSGTLDAARLPLATTGAAGAVIVGTGLGVSSGTVSVTYGTSSTSACRGDDSRLSDARTPTSHTHGNITNAGAIGSTANLPVITTTSGVLTTGSFGTTANSFCQGNDSRLSDTRTPTDGSVTTTKIVDGNVSFAKLQSATGVSVIGRSANSSGVYAEIVAGTDGHVLRRSGDTVGFGTIATAGIADSAVTYAKLQNVSATDRLLGRSSAGAGVVEEISCTSFGRSVISAADAAAGRTALSVQPTASPAFTGAATVANDGNVVPLTVTNTGTANSFVVNDQAGDTTPFVIDASGNVGIGTGSPTAKVDIVAQDAVRATGFQPFFTLRDSSDSNKGFRLQTAAGIAIFYVDGDGSGTYVERFRLPAAGGMTMNTQLLVTAGSASAPGVAFSGDTNTGMFSPSADVLAWATNGAERLRIDASGNVGIGLTATERFHVGRSGTGIVGRFTDNATQTLDVGITASAGVYLDNPNSGYVDVRIGGASKFKIGSDGSLTAPDVYGDTVGATNRDLFIDSTGLIGYVSSIRASKTDIESIDDVSWLRNLTPVSFHYRKRNEDGTYSDEPDGTLDYGLIAEDVEPVAPEMCFYDVVDGEPQLRGVHYSKLITPMLRYIQQLEARIAALEEKINA